MKILNQLRIVALGTSIAAGGCATITGSSHDGIVREVLDLHDDESQPSADSGKD